METTPLNTSLPGVRLLQQWIRKKAPVSLSLINTERLDGEILWQDSEFIALQPSAQKGPVLVNRQQISTIRPLS